MQNLIRKSAFTLLMVAVMSVFVTGQSRDVGSFDAVSVSGNIEAKLQKSDSPSIKIKMIKGNIEDVITEVENGMLKVKIDNKSWFGNRNNTKAKVVIHYTDLSKVKTSAGSSLMSNEAVRSEDLVVKASSGSTMRLEVEAGTLEAGTSSGSSMKLSGSADKAKYDSSSGSSLNAKNVTADVCKADASSGASISCNASKKIKAEASSGASIGYTGSPETKEIDKSSGGSVYQKD